MLEEALHELERRLGVRPGDGLQLAAASALVRLPFDPGWPLLILGDAVAAPASGSASAFDAPVLPGRHARPPEVPAILGAL